MNKIKNLGQVETPTPIVRDILDAVGYVGAATQRHHIIDNSCGSGAFLTEILQRYLDAYREKNGSLHAVEQHLSEYIHGIDIDPDAVHACRENMNAVMKESGLAEVDWDIHCADALECRLYDGKMDYVVGNPPYVRIHNLQKSYEAVKRFSFARDGMTDLYIVFFEIGFMMLAEHGKMSYISPNSFYTSLAGRAMRKFIRESRMLYRVMELGHYQPFSAMTYTAITCFESGYQSDRVDFYRYDPETKIPRYIDTVKLNDMFIDQKMIFVNRDHSADFEKIYKLDVGDSPIEVKNGFATLADSVFIQDRFDFDTHCIDVLKASTGQWRHCFYPYDRKGRIVGYGDLKEEALYCYLDKYKERLLKRSTDKNTPWYGFGRNQAIADTYKDKIAVNILIRGVESLRLERVPAGGGVYSGLYILTEEPIESIEKILRTDDFIDYLKMINKCKSGGYYTFSSTDLRKYLTFHLLKKGGAYDQ